MKVIKVKYYWLRDLKDQGECGFIHIITKLLKANIFTQQMDFKEFEEQLFTECHPGNIGTGTFHSSFYKFLETMACMHGGDWNVRVV